MGLHSISGARRNANVVSYHQQTNKRTYYFFSFWSEELRCAILTLKMPSEFLGKKNCPYLPSRPQLSTNCIFFSLCNMYKCIYKCIVHSHVNKRICILQLITFFSRYVIFSMSENLNSFGLISTQP